MASEYDMIIVGGGCAGLSLAMRLAELGEECPRVAIVERRVSYVHDRTWSYWASESAQLKHLARFEWKKVIVGDAQARVTMDCTDMPYQTIQSGIFYQSALNDISKNSKIHLLLGLSADTIYKNNNQWEVITSKGSIRAAQLIDTRPPKLDSTRGPILWQSFSGVEVESDKEIFDENAATLMDFIEGESGEICFLYLLPFSRNRALIEATVFGKRVMTQANLAGMLESFIKKSVGSANHEIKYREYFVIPMGLAEHPKNTNDTCVAVGLHSGGARASTGYVFQRIQRWADDAALRIKEGRRVLGHSHDSWVIKKMDSIFLRVLKRYPERAPEIFIRLFSIRDTGSVIRFMNDEPTFMDILRIMSALPYGIFIKELVRGIFR